MIFPPLNAVRTFEAAARHLSYSKAAAELCVTPGAVSRAIATLEQHLEVPLFKQHRRRLQLTEAGDDYYVQVAQALQKLSGATEAVQQHRSDRGQLIIGVLPTLGTRWLIPQLTDFNRCYPEITLEIKTLPSDFSQSFVELDLDLYGVDLALYVGQKAWDGVICEPLFQEKLVPVVSPQCTHCLDELKADNKLAQQQLLLHTTRPHVWHAWFDQYSQQAFNPLWRAKFEHYFMVIEAVTQGFGIGLIPEILIKNDLQEGRLIGLQQFPLLQKQEYYLMHNSARYSETKIRRFLDWIKERV